jgi:predicted deacylase
VKVRKGDKVAEVRNIFGELLETITSPIDGIISYRRVPYPVCRKMSVIGILPDEDLPPPPAPPFP